MLAEEVAVVAEENDDGVLELAVLSQRLEDHADAFVHRGHHRCAQANLLLVAGVQRFQDHLRFLAAFDFESVLPGGLHLAEDVVAHAAAGPERDDLVALHAPHGVWSKKLSYPGPRPTIKTRAVNAALDWLRSRGTRQYYFKYCSTFDSTPQGNIGPVTEALMDALGATFVVITPAFPENARTVFKGHLFVGGAPLNESGMEKKKLN